MAGCCHYYVNECTRHVSVPYVCRVVWHVLMYTV